MSLAKLDFGSSCSADEFTPHTLQHARRAEKGEQTCQNRGDPQVGFFEIVTHLLQARLNEAASSPASSLTEAHFPNSAAISNY